MRSVRAHPYIYIYGGSVHHKAVKKFTPRRTRITDWRFGSNHLPHHFLQGIIYDSFSTSFDVDIP